MSGVHKRSVTILAQCDVCEDVRWQGSTAESRAQYHHMHTGHVVQVTRTIHEVYGGPKKARHQWKETVETPDGPDLRCIACGVTKHQSIGKLGLGLPHKQKHLVVFSWQRDGETYKKLNTVPQCPPTKQDVADAYWVSSAY